MKETIYIDDLECPYCNRDTYIESWDIVVKPDNIAVTTVVCDNCHFPFGVRTKLSIEVIDL